MGKRISECTKIHAGKFGCMPERSTPDESCTLKRTIEKYTLRFRRVL